MEIPKDIVTDIESAPSCEVRLDEPMARHTSFGLGGPADLFVDPGSREAFEFVLERLRKRDVPVLVLGRGTNLLVRSGGIEGAVVATEHAFSGIDRTSSGVAVGSGVALARLLSFCCEQGLAGLEDLAGIPGSAGGAVVMNAGSFGSSIGDIVSEVRLLGRDGVRTDVPASEMRFGYRSAEIPPGAVVEEAVLELAEGDSGEIEKRVKDTLENKWRRQPANMRSAGCVFRNPPDASAGGMIDALGLKGTRVGGAVVSDMHANFILNDRGASPEDVEDLIELIAERVCRETGVELGLEIEIVGRPFSRPTGSGEGAAWVD